MDIVEWLRLKAKGFFKPTSTRLKEAANEIERLREALTNFCDAFEPHMHQERCQICSAAYHEARAALKEKE